MYDFQRSKRTVATDITTSIAANSNHLLLRASLSVSVHGWYVLSWWVDRVYVLVPTIDMLCLFNLLTHCCLVQKTDFADRDGCHIRSIHGSTTWTS